MKGVTRQKRGQEGEPKSFLIGGIIGVVFLLIVIGGIWYVSSSGGKALAEVNREDLDTKINFGCVPSYKEGNFDAKISFCQKFDPIGGSLLFGSDNYISCQYRPAIEIMLQNGDIDAPDLASAVNLINSFCATDLIPNAKNGDELAFATKFCTTEKARTNNFKDGLKVNGFVFDKECGVTTYPDWYENPSNDLANFVLESGNIKLDAFTYNGAYTFDGKTGKISGNNVGGATFLADDGSPAVYITRDNIGKLQAVGDSKMPNL
ncbi:hypothetical protein J4477_04185 [Candidatus Pacearchaeota archaeon]|nr:hypothetical protein [Candidatus Pacearchaeota archaeon]